MEPLLLCPVSLCLSLFWSATDTHKHTYIQQYRECCPLVAHRRPPCRTHNVSAARRNSPLDSWLRNNSSALHRSLRFHPLSQGWIGFTFLCVCRCEGGASSNSHLFLDLLPQDLIKHCKQNMTSWQNSCIEIFWFNYRTLDYFDVHLDGLRLQLVSLVRCDNFPTGSGRKQLTPRDTSTRFFMITSHTESRAVGPNAELYLWWRSSPSHTGEIGSLPIFGEEVQFFCWLMKVHRFSLKLKA